MTSAKIPKISPLRVLKGVRVLSLALNLPGPAAMMRCRQMGARCVKLEPPSADPMNSYSPSAYAALHQGVRVMAADLKTIQGQKALHRELAKTDVLLTSFRPSAMVKLGLTWKALHRQYPGLSQIAIVGAPGERAEEPGHDLTYLAENDLITGLDLPATLYADMGGSLMASEAVLKASMHKAHAGKGVYIEVALSEAASYLALPRSWGLTSPHATVGGGHAGYQIYECKDGRVAVAALEPHFAARLCAAAGISGVAHTGSVDMLSIKTQHLLGAFFLAATRSQLEKLAGSHDLPLHTLSK